MLDKAMMFSKDKKRAFEVDQLAQGIIQSDAGGIPVGSPVLYDSRSKNLTIENRGIAVFVVFPPCYNAPTSYGTWEVSSASVIPIDLKPLPVDYLVKRVEAFDYSRLDDIRSFIAENAAITLFGTFEDDLNSFYEALTPIRREFKYSTIFHMNRRGLIKRKQDYVISLSFYNMLYSIPVFNTKEMDGAAVALRVMDLNQGSAGVSRPVIECAMVVSNHTENVLTIDGSELNPNREFDAVTKSGLKSWLEEQKHVILSGSKSPASPIKMSSVKPSNQLEELSVKYSHKGPLPLNDSDAPAEVTYYFNSSSTTTNFSSIS